MGFYDYLVVAVYLVFMASIGVIFKKFSKDSSDFFRGGGNVLWWLVGSTAFMSQFSAWTFIGAASYAYTDGTLVMMLLVGNGVGYLIAAVCLLIAAGLTFVTRPPKAITFPEISRIGKMILPRNRS